MKTIAHITKHLVLADSLNLDSHTRKPVSPADSMTCSNVAAALQAAGGMTLRAAWLLESRPQLQNRIASLSPTDAEARLDRLSFVNARALRDRPQTLTMLPGARLSGDPAARSEDSPPSDGGDP